MDKEAKSSRTPWYRMFDTGGNDGIKKAKDLNSSTMVRRVSVFRVVDLFSAQAISGASAD